MHHIEVYYFSQQSEFGVSPDLSSILIHICLLNVNNPVTYPI